MRPPRRSLPHFAVAGLAAALLFSPAPVAAATNRQFPVVKAVLPLKLHVGATLTILGRNFVPGAGHDTVVFQHPGSAAVFAHTHSATSTKITVVVPTKLDPFLTGAAKQAPVATRFRIRVLARRFELSFTTQSLSPIIEPGPSSQQAAALSCAQEAKANPNGDQDADGMSNALELRYGTDPCNPDTDGDGVTDGYEYYAALDLNGASFPYPASEPWPNPLDPSDANDDFDGDGLTMKQEFTLWKYVGAAFPLEQYSDGTQNSGGLIPVTTPQMATLDLDGDGYLEDDERDADGDGLSNIVELSTTGTQAWWAAKYPGEVAYSIRHFSELSPTNPDSDGDGIPDGQDDQDNDGWNNFEEMQLGRERTGLRVQPYNPCLPDPYAPTCSRSVPLSVSQAWPPFDGSQKAGDAIPFSWPLPSATAVPGWNGLGGPQGPTT